MPKVHGRKLVQRKVPFKSKSDSSSKSISSQRIMEMSWGFAPPLIVEAALRNGVFKVMDGIAKIMDGRFSGCAGSERRA